MTPQELKYSILGDAFTGKLCKQTEPKDFGGIETIELPETPYDVPYTWVWSTLGLCCEMYTGNSISETVKATKYAGLKTGYDYIATKDVTFNQEICYDNGIRIPYDEGFKVAYRNAVLMCIEGGSAGRKIGIIDRDVCFGNKLCSFHVRGIDNKYLFYYLQSWLFKELFSENMTGIIGGVSIKKLKKIPIPVAPLPEQKRIVAKIEELLPYIDRYEKAWSRLEDLNKRFPVDMQKSILQMAIQGKLVEQRPEEGTAEELYQQIQEEKKQLIKAGKIKKGKSLPEITEDEIPFDIPESWKWVRLGNVCWFQGGYAYKSTSYVHDSRNQIIRLGNVKQNQLLLDTKPTYIPDSIAEVTEAYLIKKNDILVTMTGTRRKKDYLFVTRINDADLAERKLYINQRVGCFRVIDHRIESEYLQRVLQSEAIRDIIFERETGTANQGNLGSEDMKMYIYVPLPPLAEQKRIVAKLEEILPLCEKLK